MDVVIVEQEDTVAEVAGLALALRELGESVRIVPCRSIADIDPTDGGVLLAPVPRGEAALDLVEALRARAPTTPLAVTSADSTPELRVAILDAGADDVLPEACHPREIAARLRSLLRRSSNPPEPPVVISVPDQAALRAGRKVPLTAMMQRVLAVILEGEPTRAEIAERLWGNATDAVLHTLDQHLAGLRRALRTIDVVLDCRRGRYRLILLEERKKS